MITTKPLSEEVFRDVLKQEIQSSEKRLENKVLEFKETIEKHLHIQPAA